MFKLLYILFVIKLHACINTYKLEFGNTMVKKKEFHISKKPITFNFVDIDKTKIFDKFKRSDKGFKHFIGYNDNNIIRRLCII